MDEQQQTTFEEYQRKGFANRGGFGAKPALLIVDFINGFTDPTTDLGGDFSGQLAVTNELLSAFRAAGLPIIYTTVVYETHLRDAGVFIKKVPALSLLVRGSKMVEVDARIEPQNGDYVLEKKFASSFFGTDLDAYLRSHGVDTVIMTGCTTSGCIRASAIDAMQYGYSAIVVKEGVGDRAQGPHEANLFDIDAKYGDVVTIDEALEYMRSITTSGGFAAKVSDDFRRWWHDGAGAPG